MRDTPIYLIQTRAVGRGEDRGGDGEVRRLELEGVRDLARKTRSTTRMAARNEDKGEAATSGRLKAARNSSNSTSPCSPASIACRHDAA